ncbi:MAG: NAD(P)/FAD-dependent oxidoreductase [Pseudomonadota bacterium]
MIDRFADNASQPPNAAAPDYDVVIIGAGLSGVGAAWHLQRRRPRTRFVILEARGAIGGTWDLFRYPGMRSDSDMFTLGYRFQPWRRAEAIVEGGAIRDYVREAAQSAGVDKKIRFRHRVTSLDWSSNNRLWTLNVQTPNGPAQITSRFVWNCAGYYRYKEGYTPDYAGRSAFKGRLIHPQHWPEDLNVTDKKIAIIGSGATTVTLAPALAKAGGEVTIVQRTPSYVYAMASVGLFAKALYALAPSRAAYHIIRLQRIILQQTSYQIARRFPRFMKNQLINQATEKLGGRADLAAHFSPDYAPWDQRVCLAPDDDLFNAIRDGRVDMKTDTIETFTETGLRLRASGALDADIVVSATGLILEALGGADVHVDGALVETGKRLTYKGIMFEGVPNLVSVFGYTNASWTLRADLISDFVCRLLAHMQETGALSATPVNDDPDMPRTPYLDFTSGYVARANAILPKQGRGPWRNPQNYFKDIWSMRFARLTDGVLRFE